MYTSPKEAEEFAKKYNITPHEYGKFESRVGHLSTFGSPLTLKSNIYTIWIQAADLVVFP